MKLKKFDNFISENIDSSIDQKKLFKEYLDGDLHLVNIINILMNDMKNKWYSKIGEYFIETVGLDFLEKNHPSIRENIKNNRDNILRFIGILFITGYLNEQNLKKMFGEPIKHSEFGEGFERKRKYECCSYFVEVNGNILHITFDQRGTSIECEEKLTPIETFDTIKKLIDIFKTIIG